MSAIIIPFPLQKCPAATRSGSICEVLPAKKQGFSYIDAIVPMDVAAELMNLLAECQSNDPHLDFEISQPSADSLVLVDACVPTALATEFQRLAAAA
jgi:hypothetical protein